MKICFPVRKPNGNEHTSLVEVMSLIGREPHGSWLAGTNHLWHGGIHISQVSALGSVLTAETAEAAVPLQCMAVGEVVAWRLNQDYKKADYNGKELRYSSTFVLVKSTCKPDFENENSWLEFYSLYMGLAPLSAFPKVKCYKAKTDVLKRTASKFERSASSGGIEAAPGQCGELKKNERVIIQKQQEFRNGSDVQPFGLARTLNANGDATGNEFWVTLLPEFMEPDGELYAQLPTWMQEAVNQCVFDSVVKPAARLDIEAGDAIGFLGEDIAPAGKGNTNTCHYAHIEVISTDARVHDFLSNSAGITSGQKFIRLHPSADLYSKSGDGEQTVFTKTTTTTDENCGTILRVADCSPIEDTQHKTWFKVSNYSWMAQDDVDQLNQYDLKELGFSALEEEPSPDVSKSLRENWVKGAYHWLSEQIGKDRGIQQKQVSTFYKNMVKEMDKDGNGKLSGRELYNALHHPELGLRNIAARLVVKHDSEWFGGSSHQRWKFFFQNYDRLRIAYAKQWLDDCEWMSQVDEFKSGKPVWHFHPVMFLNALKSVNKECYCYKQGIVERPCQTGARNVTKNDFELLAGQLGVEREVLRAIAIAETGDKVPFKQYVGGEDHATILYERHYMKRLALKLGVSPEKVREIESSEPKIIHDWEQGYRYGTENEQYERLVRARKINYDAANMSCSWGKFQVMGEYFHHLYGSTQELVDAQNYCALQHLQYFKIFLVEEKKMLQSMKDKNWLTIARKYNGARQEGYDEKIRNAYNSLKNEW